MLIVHIGLPKTASTFLQYRIFRTQDRYTYIHNAKSGPLEKGLKRFVRAADDAVDDALDRVVKNLPDTPTLVSDENISMNGAEPWRDAGPVPDETGRRLRMLAERVGELRVVLGVRRQDTWFASRYAESAKLFEDFCQEDFERRIAVLDRDRLVGALSWLRYDRAYQHLAEAVGAANVCVVPTEMVGDDLPEALRMLEDFLGVDGWLEAVRTGGINQVRNNVLSVGDGEWRMRGHEGQMLRLSQALSDTILDTFRDCNRELVRRVRLPLERFGYF